MQKMTESDLLRLAMILENQEQTTLEKNLCKLAECVIFDSSKSELTSYEICQKIEERFQLQFDVLEIENAIKSKGRGRIVFRGKKYHLEPKVNNELSSSPSVASRLKSFIKIFSSKCETEVDEGKLLELIQEYIYHCFNSSVSKFIDIIGKSPVLNINEDVFENFKPSNDEVDLINAFVSWEHPEKNKFLYSLISSSYEYCLITTKKNISYSKTIFNKKRFILDTNIIFRIAGINNGESKLIIKTFIDKCLEVGIKIFYTNEVLDEIYRVVDAQVNYIKAITQYQPPVDSSIIAEMTNQYEVNDFYVLFCEWCKEPQNKYHDYISFRNFLLQKIIDAISPFDIIQVQNYKNSDDSAKFLSLFDNLKQYKIEKRPYRTPSDASIRTDLNNVLYIESLRNETANNLLYVNDYIISADQLLVNWTNNEFPGVSIATIPSVWLSIILKISGRATNDDYRSFCNFMTLSYRPDVNEININPVILLSKLAEKTINKEIKEKVIKEILTNRSEYSFIDETDYDDNIEKAFDIVLGNEKDAYKEEMKKAVDEEAQKNKIRFEEYEAQLAERKTEEEYARKYAQNKSKKKVDKFANNKHIPLILVGLLLVVAVFFVAIFMFKINPMYNFLFGFLNSENMQIQPWSIITWCFTVITGVLSTYFISVWNYLSSEDRKNKLYSKYLNEQLTNLKYRD